MRISDKNLLVVGDRVLIAPEAGEERTKVGLVLPATAIEKNQVHSGRIVEVGPGTPIPTPAEVSDEPWRTSSDPKPHYMPMEAAVGDFALFLRNAAIEIVFEGDRFLVVPHEAILLLVRQEPEAGIDESFLPQEPESF